MSIHPVEIRRLEERQVAIVWSDGQEQILSARLLRDRCPCAACRQTGTAEPPGGLRVLSPAETMPLEILAMGPVGNYAYQIQFSDGHDTGIFTFDLIRSFADR